MSAYAELMAHARETKVLSQVARRLSWDQQTVMPRGAALQRAEEMAAIEGVLHARRTDPRVADWLAVAEPLGAVQQGNLRIIRREHERAARVPGRLAAEIARVTSAAQGAWAAARAADNVTSFIPVLAEVLRLKREAAAALSDGGPLYDALLQGYEPGATTVELDSMFDALRPRLVALRERLLGAPPAGALAGDFPVKLQLRLAREIATAFGYDLDRGRIDRAAHPFSAGSGLDVRITTRTDPTNPMQCLYSTIHEVGHATYEQGVDADYRLTPAGRGVSMGVHESQSRLYENQLARSRAFTGWLFGRMSDVFGDLSAPNADALYASINHVAPSHIRVEADEVHYNLHVLMRYDLERAMIEGDLEAADLPGAWNERFERDFGVAVDRPSNGCLQDVHWSVGHFGYFPTYTLGNVYAGCLNAALRRDLPDLDAALARGDPSPATAWLRERVQRHGGVHEARALIERATGEAPSAEPLLAYLEAKFGALYGPGAVA